MVALHRRTLCPDHRDGATNCEPLQKCEGSPAQVIGSSTERFALYAGADEAFGADPPDAFDVHCMVDDSLLRDTGCTRRGNAYNWLEEKNFAYLVQHRKHTEMLAALRTADRRRAVVSELESGETLVPNMCILWLEEVSTICGGRGVCGLKCARI